MCYNTGAVVMFASPLYCSRKPDLPPRTPPPTPYPPPALLHDMYRSVWSATKSVTWGYRQAGKRRCRSLFFLVVFVRIESQFRQKTQEPSSHEYLLIPTLLLVCRVSALSTRAADRGKEEGLEPGVKTADARRFAQLFPFSCEGGAGRLSWPGKRANQRGRNHP